MVMTETLPNIFDNVCKEIGLSVIGTSVELHGNRIELHGLGANNRVPIETLERLRRMKYPDWQEWGPINTRENMIDSGHTYLDQMIDIAIDHELAWRHDDDFMEIHITSFDFWAVLGHIYDAYQSTLEQVACSFYPEQTPEPPHSEGPLPEPLAWTPEQAAELQELFESEEDVGGIEPLNFSEIFNIESDHRSASLAC